MIALRRGVPAVRLLGLGLALALLLAVQALAAPTFPQLTGRVVDEADLLSASTEARISEKLAALEARTGDQVVVVTLASLQGYEIEDYGYQLGRAWGVGRAEENNGVLLIVAPNERKVRLEVGYGLEPVLTDALSSVIIQTHVLPRFRANDYAGGVSAGVDAVVEQLSLDRGEAMAIAEAAETPSSQVNPVAAGFVFLIVVFIVMSLIGAGLRGGRRYRGRGGRGDGLTPILIWAAAEALRSRGGGGSFGGGGASGGW